jgi:phosphohistidine phosphatase
MKRLTVLRHAKSSWEEPNTDDFDRPLNERGWKAARRIGRELRRQKMTFDLALASPAARVRETLDGVQEGFGEFAFELRFDGRIYMASASTLLDLVRELPESVEAALIVGHNPGLERLVVSLARDDDNHLRRRVQEKFPTAALAVVELQANGWNDVQEGSGTVTELIVPRDLD